MDIETTGAIEQVHVRIDGLEHALRTEIRQESASTRSELRDEIRQESAAIRSKLRDEIRQESAATRSELREEIRQESAAIRSELRDEIRESLAGAKRHAEVLTESVRDDIRMLAEAVATMSTRRDAIRPG